MQNNKVFAAAAISAIFGCLSGCSSTGGDIGGLLPAPKFLKGDIGDDDVYTAKDKRFTVSVPFIQGTDNYRYMHVKEQYSETEDYVSFGPGAVDQRIYRIDLGIPHAGMPLPTLDAAAPQVLSGIEAQARQAYVGEPVAGEASRLKLGGHDAYHWHLRQAVPAGKLANVPVTLEHELYLIDLGTTLATVWVQTPVDNLSDRQALTPEQFAESLKITAPPAQ